MIFASLAVGAFGGRLEVAIDRLAHDPNPEVAAIAHTAPKRDRSNGGK